MQLPSNPGPIGVFDSGYGGLTILHGIRQLLPQYDYMYLGDNARAPYGTRSFDIVYQFTRQAVLKLFSMGCQLVILGCNTASAKALRTIQQHDLPGWDDTEIATLFPDIRVSGVACPFWVPLVEYNEADSPGADYFVKKRIDELMAKDPAIDTIILGCTHYPILLPKIQKYVKPGVRLIPQGEYVAQSLAHYLDRHTALRQKLTLGATCQYFTTENPDKFKESAQIFLKEQISVRHLDLE